MYVCGSSTYVHCLLSPARYLRGCWLLAKFRNMQEQHLSHQMLLKQLFFPTQIFKTFSFSQPFSTWGACTTALRRRRILSNRAPTITSEQFSLCTAMPFPWTLFVEFLEGFPELAGKESPCNAGDTEDMGSIPGLGRCPGGGYGYPFQYPCLESPMDRGAWQTAVHGITKSQTPWSGHTGNHYLGRISLSHLNN